MRELIFTKRLWQTLVRLEEEGARLESLSWGSFIFDLLRSTRKIDRILAARTLTSPSRHCDDGRVRAAVQEAFFRETSPAVKELLADALARLVAAAGGGARLDDQLGEALGRVTPEPNFIPQTFKFASQTLHLTPQNFTPHT